MMKKLIFAAMLFCSAVSFSQITGVLTDPADGCNPFDLTANQACGSKWWAHVGMLDSGVNVGDGIWSSCTATDVSNGKCTDAWSQCTSWTQTYPTAGTGSGAFTTNNCPAVGQAGCTVTGKCDCSPAINTALQSCGQKTYLLLDKGIFNNATPIAVGNDGAQDFIELRGTVANEGLGNTIATHIVDIAGNYGYPDKQGDLIRIGSNAGGSNRGPNQNFIGNIGSGSAAAGKGSSFSNPVNLTSIPGQFTVAGVNAGKQMVAISELLVHGVDNYTGNQGSLGGSAAGFNWGPNHGSTRLHPDFYRITGCNGHTATYLGGDLGNGTGVNNDCALHSGVLTVTTDPPLIMDYQHQLADRATNTYYGLGEFIAPGNGHYYINCGAPQTTVVSPTPSSWTAGTPVTVYFGNTDVNNKASGTVQNPACAFYNGQAVQINFVLYTISSVTPNASCTWTSCPYGGTFVLTPGSSVSGMVGKAITNQYFQGWTGSGAAPTYPTDGSSVVDSSALPNSAVWEDMGTCPNNPCDTYPQYAPWNGNNRQVGVKYLDVQTMQNLTSTSPSALYPRAATCTGATCIGNNQWNGNIAFYACTECWASGIESQYSFADHVYFGGGTFRVSLLDFYLSNNWQHNPGAHDGVVSLNEGSMWLVQNGICERLHGCVIPGRGAGVGVTGYVYSTGAFNRGSTSGDSTASSLYQTHSPTVHAVLVEGLVGPVFHLDNIWGSDGWFHTFYRDWATGSGRVCAPTTLPSSVPTVTCGQLYGPTCNPSDSSCPWSYPLASNVSAMQFQIAGPWIFDNQTSQTNLLASVGGSEILPFVRSYAGTKLGVSSTYDKVIANNGVPPGTLDCSSSKACRSYGGFLIGYNVNFNTASDTGTWPTSLSPAPSWTTLGQDGVYDFFTNSIIWKTTQHSFPASLYLSTQPRWWNYAGTWGKTIGPDSDCHATLSCDGDVNGGGHNLYAYATKSNPAQAYYLGTMGGTDGGGSAVGQVGALPVYDPTSFYQAQPLSPYFVIISCDGLGTGSITSSDNKITMTCNAGVATCTQGTITPDNAGCKASNYTGVETPTYTATPTGSSAFQGWVSGGCSGNGTCSPVVTTDPNPVATFNVIPTTTISVSVATTNAGNPLSLTLGSTNLVGGRWLVTAYDAINVDGYVATPIACASPSASCTGSPLVIPVLPTTYVITGVSSSGVPSTSNQVTVQVQSPLSYGVFQH